MSTTSNCHSFTPQEIISYSEYKKLGKPKDYSPIFTSYRKKKIKTCCDECGRFSGYKLVNTTGIGRPRGYIRIMTNVRLHTLIDNIYNPNPLMNSITNGGICKKK